MLRCFLKSSEQAAVPIVPVVTEHFSEWVSLQDGKLQKWVQAVGFQAKSSKMCLVPGSEGGLHSVLLGLSDDDDFWAFGALPKALPQGVYTISPNQFPSSEQHFRALLAWGLGAYQFSHSQKRQDETAQLLLPEHYDAEYLMHWVESIYHGRDWINMPADLMTPEELAKTAKELAKSHHGGADIIVGDKLLKENYPMVHAVGRGSQYEPRLIDLRWGDAHAPMLTVVGKGVCFDSGGLDIKSAAGMRQMKKDMGGAAHALALASMIMKQNLPIRLRVLIPAVENSVGSRSYRPGDIIETRAGIHVEIGNTDAEGRLVMCDALAAAAEEKPKLLIDFSTLTGAARVALGSELPAFFCNQDKLANAMVQFSQEQHDPLWHMPLYQPYLNCFKSDIADICNIATKPIGGGAIIAALYLQQFVPDDIPWMHFDFMASNIEARPGRPKGGEIQVLRAVFSYLKEDFIKR